MPACNVLLCWGVQLIDFHFVISITGAATAAAGFQEASPEPFATPADHRQQDDDSDNK